MSLFPALQPIVSDAAADSTALPMTVEPAWDFDADRPVFRGGQLQRVTGLEAVKVWAWNALLTVRRMWPALSPNYGNDCDRLIGTAYSDDLKKAEAARYVTECLVSSPYISSVAVGDIAFDEAAISISAIVSTIYGEVSVNV